MGKVLAKLGFYRGSALIEAYEPHRLLHLDGLPSGNAQDLPIGVVAENFRKRLERDELGRPADIRIDMGFEDGRSMWRAYLAE